MKKYYWDEKMSIGYNIGATIFAVMMIIVNVALLNQWLNDKIPFNAFIIIFAMLGFFVLMLLHQIFANIYYVRKNLEVVELFVKNGKKVSGKIKSFEYRNYIDYKNSIFKRADFIRESYNSRYCEYRIAKVEFECDGKRKTIETPPIDFIDDYLLDKNVDVYIYQEKYYVGNYNLDYNKKEKNKKEINNYKIKIFLTSFVYLLSLFLIILFSNKLFGKEVTLVLFFSTMIIFLIVISIIYYKYNKFIKEECINKDKK